MGGDVETLRPQIALFREAADRAGVPPPEVVLMTALTADPPGATAQVGAFSEIGVTHLVLGSRYGDVAEFSENLETLGKHVLPVVSSL